MADRKNRQKAGKGRGGKRRTSWPPGRSGNPKGRTPLPEDYKLAMDVLGPKGMSALEAILDNPNHPRHEQCAEYVVNRWRGTPTVKAEVGGPGGGPIPVKAVRTSDEKRARMRQLAEKAAALVGARAIEQQERQGTDDGGTSGSD